jgi:hypothetical protein
MLSFDIRSLQSAAAAVDGELAPDDAIWQEGDPRPATPVHVVGRLSTAGPGRYYFSGRIEGTVSSECRRCLADCSEQVAADSHLIFAEAGLDEADDESDVFVLDRGARSLDLRPGKDRQVCIRTATAQTDGIGHIDPYPLFHPHGQRCAGGAAIGVKCRQRVDTGLLG